MSAVCDRNRQRSEALHRLDIDRTIGVIGIIDQRSIVDDVARQEDAGCARTQGLVCSSASPAGLSVLPVVLGAGAKHCFKINTQPNMNLLPGAPSGISAIGQVGCPIEENHAPWCSQKGSEGLRPAPLPRFTGAQRRQTELAAHPFVGCAGFDLRSLRALSLAQYSNGDGSEPTPLGLR